MRDFLVLLTRLIRTQPAMERLDGRLRALPGPGMERFLVRCLEGSVAVLLLAFAVIMWGWVVR
jgi:hypothetical protein